MRDVVLRNQHCINYVDNPITGCGVCFYNCGITDFYGFAVHSRLTTYIRTLFQLVGITILQNNGAVMSAETF